jgi:hypothetical protein
MTTSSSARPGAGVVWAMVEPGFHVASRQGNFVGYIDRQRDGRYLATDMRSRDLGAFPDLAAAMRAVVEAPVVLHQVWPR